MGLRYEEEFTIPFAMTDVKQELILSQFISYCLGLSGRQSESVGRGDMDVFEQYGLVWVVTDYDIEIFRLPTYNETVRIVTEAISYNKFFCYRKFFIYDEAGNLIMDILSYFVLLDFETRKVAPVPDDLIAPYQSEKVKKIQRAPRYHVLENPESKDYRIRYFDIDMNGHVNNSKYLEWMYDALEYEFLLEHHPVHVQLKYVKEVSPGGHISSKVLLDNLTSQHEIWSEGTVHAQAIITWEKRDDRKG
ncbi:acyl-ACP thioesterase domain-containing protein [Streptococcus ovis]|uniref:acyl-ACP thioesterase domain-containing protein n=1 Tax=Streptococcus ovis TaxID=82806 RepID=UPI0003641BF4|nr:acyl-ACP thioesterase domain-containing protein [Streptococcus ovis]